MAKSSMKIDFQTIREKVIKAIKIDWIDEHQSLTFLQKNYGIKPSAVLTILIIFIATLIILLDGVNLVASVVCFLMPLLKCLQELSGSKSKFALSSLNISNQNSNMTDEQLSQIMSHRSQLEIAQAYTVYFIFYGLTEVLTPIISFLMGSISWLILRVLLTLLLMAKQKQVMSKLLEMLGKKSIIIQNIYKQD